MTAGFEDAALRKAMRNGCGQPDSLARALFRACCRFVSLIVVLSLMSASLGPASASEVPAALHTTLELLDDRYLSVRVENTGAVPLTLELRDTPLDPVLAADVLSIDRPVKGWSPIERLGYIGRQAKRLPPGAADRLTLAPGAGASATLDLATLYRIRIEADYRIALRAPWPLVGADRRSRAVDSGPLPALTGHLRPLPASTANRLRPASYSNCTTGQQRDIALAAVRAEVLADRAADGVAGLAELSLARRAGSPRYTRWFGSWDDVRHGAVSQRLDTIASTLQARQIAFDCSCEDDGVFAYVFPLRPYEIFVCPVFWSAALDGTDSRAGTIVHELSHFELVAGTDDHVYTQSRAAELARTSPDLAIDNADSYEYFAENTPALALVDGVDDDLSGGIVSPDAPVDDAQLADAGQLRPGERAEGALLVGERRVFRIEGATLVQLESLEGDADLELFADASLAEPVCESRKLPPIADACTVDRGVVWARVSAIDGARFALLALALGDSPESAQPVVATLTPGDSVDAAIELGQQLRYGLSQVSDLSLESIDGDVDLYVFDGPVALEERLLCTANLDPSAATRDGCAALPGGAGLAVVVGHTAGSFRLSAGPVVAPEGQDRPADDGPTSVSESTPDSNERVRAGGSGLVLLSLLTGAAITRRIVARLAGVALAALSVNACTPAPAVDAAQTRSGSAASGTSPGGGEQLATIAVSMQLLDAATGRIRIVARHGPGGGPVKLLLWNGPFESTLSASSVFSVERDGVRLDYAGRLVKRGAPVAAAWHALGVEEALQNELVLGEAYDLAAPGAYAITLLPASVTVMADIAAGSTPEPVVLLPQEALRFER